LLQPELIACFCELENVEVDLFWKFASEYRSISRELDVNVNDCLVLSDISTNLSASSIVELVFKTIEFENVEIVTHPWLGTRKGLRDDI
jgi:hypothetical protein